MSYYGRWKPYVPVAKRRAQAQKKMAALQKKGTDIQPITIEGRKIARTFWGEGWCNHLESFSDYDNRLPRGRTYVRNGSVCHLAIKNGQVEAKVAGSELYEIRVKIKTLSTQRWNEIKKRCAGQIGSLLELLQGNLSDKIMTVVTDRKIGLFPSPAEIEFKCDCPDYASMCKHVAATLYGVGARLDDDPSLLFRLRGVNHEELIANQVAAPAGTGKGRSKRLVGNDLGDVFGIDIAATTASSRPTEPTRKRMSKKTATSDDKNASMGNQAKTKIATTTKKTIKAKPPTKRKGSGSDRNDTSRTTTTTAKRSGTTKVARPAAKNSARIKN